MAWNHLQAHPTPSAFPSCSKPQPGAFPGKQNPWNAAPKSRESPKATNQGNHSHSYGIYFHTPPVFLSLGSRGGSAPKSRGFPYGRSSNSQLGKGADIAAGAAFPGAAPALPGIPNIYRFLLFTGKNVQPIYNPGISISREYPHARTHTHTQENREKPLRSQLQSRGICGGEIPPFFPVFFFLAPGPPGYS